jgi:hypothetical protein
MKYITLFILILLFGCTKVPLENTSWFSRYNKYSNDYNFEQNEKGSVKKYGASIKENDDEYCDTKRFNYLFEGKSSK